MYVFLANRVRQELEGRMEKTAYQEDWYVCKKGYSGVLLA